METELSLYVRPVLLLLLQVPFLRLGLFLSPCQNLWMLLDKGLLELTFGAACAATVLLT